MKEKIIVFENVQKFEKWINSKELKKDCSIFVTIGDTRKLVGCIYRGVFQRLY